MRIGEHYHLFVGNIQEFSSQHASVVFVFFFKQRRGNIKKEREKGKAGGRKERKKDRQVGNVDQVYFILDTLYCSNCPSAMLFLCLREVGQVLLVLTLDGKLLGSRVNFEETSSLDCVL